MGYLCYSIHDAVRTVEDELVDAANSGDLPGWVDPCDAYIRKQRANARREQKREQKRMADAPLRRHGGAARQLGQPSLPEPTADEELADKRQSVIDGHRETIVLSVDVEAAPAAVKTRCREWLDEHRDSIEYRDGADFVEFRTFQVVFDVDDDGTVSGAEIRARFKDH